MRMNQHSRNPPVLSRDGYCEALVSRSRRLWTLFALLALGLVMVQAVGFAEVTDFPIPSENEFVKKGFLPVTLFGAVPDDELDDTAAIQKTVDAALEEGYVVFFPSGRYLVSDTIRAMQPVEWHEKKRKWMHNRLKANALIGSTRSERPRLVLAADSPGFNDPSKPKPLVWIWAQPRDERPSASADSLGSNDPKDEQPSISMNQVFKGIDIDLRAEGNRGAVGIRHAGSQGSTLEDVDIWAEGAFAGIMNSPGQGGGNYRIKILGGDYGVWANYLTRFPVFAGLRLIGQRKAAIHWDGQSNMTVAGFYIERNAPGPAIELRGKRKVVGGSLTLVDGVIRVRSGIAVDNSSGRNLYLKQVAVTGADSILRSAGQEVLKPRGAWTQVVEYAYAGEQSVIIVDGQEQAENSELAVLEAGAEVEPAALESRHVWGDGFPSFEDSDVADATQFGALPDDQGDDTAAIEKAFASSANVFLPKGAYVVSSTLTIPKDKHLFGAAKHLTVIRASERWNAKPGTPVVTTADGVSSAASLSFLQIESGAAQPHTPLVWHAGRESIVRDIMVDLSFQQTSGRGSGGGRTGGRLDTYRIHGGGRWYGVAAPWERLRAVSKGSDYRHLRIADSKEPLAIYGLNIERSHSDPQSEIRNSENVSIYYLKGETLERENHPVLSIVDSRNIEVFGYSGNAMPVGNAVISLAESEHIVLANVAPIRQSESFWTVSDIYQKSPSYRVSGRRAVVLFKRLAGIVPSGQSSRSFR